MAWTARSLRPELPMVEIVVHGSITQRDSDEMRATLRAMLVDENVSLVLYDATDLIHPPSSTDIIAVADSIVATHVPDGFRNAHIRPTDVTAAMWTDHWVAAANNRGLPTAVFHTRAEAVEWLLAG